MADRVAVSKFLSYVLRHAPEEADLTMDRQGWVEVAELLTNAPDHLGLDRGLLDEVVATSDKQRFALSPDGSRIRANQGHSVDVDLGLDPQVPPDVLFHGTARRFLDGILADGLRPGDRHDVHLSADRVTARRVGARHGRPVVLEIDAAGLHRAGHEFRRSANGVWLTDFVPASHLRGAE